MSSKRHSTPSMRSILSQPKKVRVGSSRNTEGIQDEFLEADLTTSKLNRNAVKLHGYESDSSTEAKQTKADDSDMFGESTKDQETKLKVRFMEINEIQGQEMSSKDLLSEIDTEDDDDVPDEEIGPSGKKRNAPQIEAFNMKNDLEEGKFDEQGNFVRNVGDPNAKHDVWLEGISKKDIRKAKEAQEKQLKKNDDDSEIFTEEELLRELIEMLDLEETVLNGIRRLGKGDKKDMERKQRVEKITGLADKLFAKGHIDIYQDTRELLIGKFNNKTGTKWIDKDNKQEDMYEYKWPGQEDIHGPYSIKEINDWAEAGYFDNGISVRIVGTSIFSSEIPLRPQN
ncbi:LIN1-like protein [Neolecta irregularis DAH-3]|uniref:LIN1-like protein n=1 Tax=Neolecta irregularis (strain DAH-3) TaxID=1198029 RepID=A0A1U7LWR9_NEOID|nr:LIN1-like protein [Neolecta irregularis DAH-3]|eukprot:OLL27117.1 LIN1-like protein [Neolecta irregularis DAH-3]